MADRYPWFPFYVDDFTTSRKVVAMTAEEIGVYILLLMSQWKDGPIPDDDALLDAICKGAVNAAGTVLERCFNETPDGWVNERLEEIREQQKEKRKQKVRAGKASAKARRAKKIERRSNAAPTPVERTRNDTDAELDTDVESEEDQEQEQPHDLPTVESRAREPGETNGHAKRGVPPEILENPWFREHDDRGEKVIEALRILVRGKKLEEYALQVARARPGPWRNRIYQVADDILADRRSGELDYTISRSSLIKAINNR